MAIVGAPRALTESSEPPFTLSRRGRPLLPRLFLLPAAAIYFLFVLWPITQAAWLSLFHWSGFGPRNFAGLTNFADLWNDSLFRQSLRHTLLWDAGALIVPTALALAIALLISRSRFQPAALTIIFFPVLLPATAVAAIWTLVYSPVSGLVVSALNAIHLGPGPSWLGDPHLALGALFVAWLWSAMGIGVVILSAGLQGISREWREIALLEGAGTLWRFRHVILPGIRRALIVVALINAALGSGVFDLLFVTTGGGPGYATTVVPLEVYGRAFGGHVGQGAAAACVQLALGLLLAAAGAAALRSDRPALETDSGTGIHLRAGSTLLLLAIASVFLLPLLWLVPLALTPGRALAIQGPRLDPESWGWENVTTAWNAGMGQALGTSLLVAFIVVAGVILLATPAAFSLFRSTSRPGKLLAAALLLVGLFQATPALLVPLFTLLTDLNLLDTLWGVVLPEVARALPFAVLTLWAFLSATPREALEAAEVDGAGPLRQMLSIAIPIARPAVLAVGIWTFATSWNEYLLPTLVSQDGSIVTVPMLLGTFIGTYNTQVGPLAAGAALAILPSLLMYLVFRREAASGVSGLRATVR